MIGDRRSVKVSDLIPGDVVCGGPQRATFVQQAQHPIWPGLRLVIWRLANGSWSHDALSAAQVVGTTDTHPQDRDTNLRSALLGRP